MPITDAQCRALKPRKKAYRASDSEGLCLEVVPGGSRLWRLRYRFQKKEKCLALGRYPDVSLLEAREKRAQAKKLLRDGVDPSAARKEAKRTARIEEGNTFEAIARDWHTNTIEKWTPAYAKEKLHRLEKDIFPEIG